MAREREQLWTALDSSRHGPACRWGDHPRDGRGEEVGKRSVGARAHHLRGESRVGAPGAHHRRPLVWREWPHPNCRRDEDCKDGDNCTEAGGSFPWRGEVQTLGGAPGRCMSRFQLESLCASIYGQCGEGIAGGGKAYRGGAGDEADHPDGERGSAGRPACGRPSRKALLRLTNNTL